MSPWADAIEELGGKLTGDAKKTVRSIRNKKQNVQDIIDRAKRGDDPSIGEDTFVRERDLGRNEPCGVGAVASTSAATGPRTIAD